jgi:hypothetical protein
MNVLAYRLTNDVEHLNLPNAPKHDANLVVAPEWDDLDTRFYRTKSIETLEPILLNGHDTIIPNTDFPYTMPRLPIMSKRMLDVLLTVGNFPHQILRVEIASFEDANIIYRQFVAVQLLEHLDVFDWVNSVYEMSTLIPGFIESIDKLVLKEPIGGFPPIFRIGADETLLYVSARARAALEQAGIRGVEFRNLTYSA